jgi:polyvinyl alcohol dehydrogenase (cytochrome)
MLVVATTALQGVGWSDGALCTDDGGTGGEWIGHQGPDVSGAKNQTAETLIGRDNVSQLQVVWRTADINTGGTIEGSTPTVSGRCVYVNGTDGFITAFDIETGAVVWRVQTAPEGSTQTYANFVDNGRVYANWGPSPGYGTASDANTGEVLYTSEPVEFGYEFGETISGALVWDNIQFVPRSGPDFDVQARPGYALIDATTGVTLHKQTTLPEEMMEAGYAGGGIWATPVVDEESGYLFVGTANPYSHTKESQYDNAILKIDLARARDEMREYVPSTEITNPFFGQIVDIYKGTLDPVIGNNPYDTPVCKELGDTPPLYTLGSHPCLQADIDFGGSPALFRDSLGRLLVGAIQKSSEFHAVLADTMTLSWRTILGNPIPPGTAGPDGNPAVDENYVYTGTSGFLWALDKDEGGLGWVAFDGAFAFAPHSYQVANGVVYSIQSNLMAFNSDDGTLLWTDVNGANNDCMGRWGVRSGGLAIAHHTIILNCGTELVAYRLPA